VAVIVPTPSDSHVYAYPLTLPPHGIIVFTDVGYSLAVSTRENFSNTLNDDECL
jgi:hypothetical protein